MRVDDYIICFPKEVSTFSLFGSEDDLNFMIAKSFATCVGFDSCLLAPVNLSGLKLLW